MAKKPTTQRDADEARMEWEDRDEDSETDDLCELGDGMAEVLKGVTVDEWLSISRDGYPDLTEEGATQSIELIISNDIGQLFGRLTMCDPEDVDSELEWIESGRSGYRVDGVTHYKKPGELPE